MIPTKSNIAKENCVPISSNCVVWQGPNLPCIGICTGDSVSDVVYRVAVEVCELKDSFGFTDVDLTCLLKICSTVPEPQKTLSAILNLVISKVCCLSDITNEIIAEINAKPAEIELTLASCFHVTNPQGVPLTKLPHSEYTLQIGLKVCEIYNTVYNDHEPRITDLENQVANIIGTPTPTLPTVTPNCVLPSIPTALNVVLDKLESDFCNLKDATGEPSEIISVLAKECVSGAGVRLASQPQLSNSALPMSNLAGWVITPQNLSDTLKNLWLSMCDVRGAVKLIQDNCCKISCKDILVNFDVLYSQTIDPDTGKPQITLTLFFGVDGVNIPSTFYDCDQINFTELTITDEHGHSVKKTIKIRDIANQTGILDDPINIGNGYDLVLLGTALNPKDDLTITADVCLTDGVTTCVKCLTINVPYNSANCNYCKITGSCDNLATNNTGFAILTFIDNETGDSQTVKIINCQSVVIPRDITPISYGISGPISLSSDCSDIIAAFENVITDFACFICPIPIARINNSSEKQYWEVDADPVQGDSPNIPGYVFNGVYTPFTQVYTAVTSGYFAPLSELKNEILNIPGVIFVDYTTIADGNKGTLNYILIQSTETVANNLELVVHVDLGGASAFNPSGADGYFKFVPYSQMNGYGSLPPCTLVPPSQP